MATGCRRCAFLGSAVILLANAQPTTAGSLKSPNIQELNRLRGGSALTTAAAGLFAASGAAAWTLPAAQLAACGFVDKDVPASLYVRQIGVWQLASALTFRAGLGGSVSAASTALLAGTISVLACIPTNEYFERSKSEAFFGALILGALGRTVAAGKVSSSWRCYFRPELHTSESEGPTRRSVPAHSSARMWQRQF